MTRPCFAARHFFPLLVALTGGAVALAVTSVFVWARRTVPFGDAFYFHYQAQLLVDGHGWFIDPFSYFFQDKAVPSAVHPPLWTLVLALADLLGIRSYFAQLFVACALDGAAVFVTALAAREAAGPGAGLTAAAIAAVYPNFWTNVDTGLSETLLLLVVACVVWAALRVRRVPSTGGAALLGVLCALCALTRAEQILLVPLVLVPVLLLHRSADVRTRLTGVLVALFATAFVLAPWVGFNLTRMKQPEFLSTELGTTLAGANCARTYAGRLLGSWSFACASSGLGTGAESEQDFHARSAALRYLDANAGRLPTVVGARVGRELGLFRPFQQLDLDHLQGKPLGPARVGLFVFWALSVGAVVGAVALRRRRTTLVPFAGILIGTVVVAATTFGSTRLRASLEVVVVVLAAVALDALLRRRRSGQSRAASRL